MTTGNLHTHPFSEIPAPDEPVTHVALADSLIPLVVGAYSLTTALVEVSREGVLTAEEMHHGLALLAGILGLAGELLDRWSHDDAAPLAEPEKTRGARKEHTS